MEDTPQAASRRPRKGWQRVTPRQTTSSATRDTFRRDAPSPAQEVLAKHDAELEDDAPAVEPDHDSDESTIICF